MPNPQATGDQSRFQMRFTEFSVACGIGESTLSILNSTLSHQSKEVISLASTDAHIMQQ